MALTVEKVAEEALGLPSAGRALLVEKLLASLAGEIEPAVERAHLDDIRRRRAATRTGKATLIDGGEASSPQSRLLAATARVELPTSGISGSPQGA